MGHRLSTGKRCNSSGTARKRATATGCCFPPPRIWESLIVRPPWRSPCSARPPSIPGCRPPKSAGKSSAGLPAERGPAMPEARFQWAADVLAGWRENVLTGTPPTLYPVGTGELERIEVGPGLVTLLGGAPGAGKTAFAMQAVVDALRLT